MTRRHKGVDEIETHESSRYDITSVTEAITERLEVYAVHDDGRIMKRFYTPATPWCEVDKIIP